MVNTKDLTDIGSILQKGLDSDETYSAVFDLLERVIPFTAATLFLYNGQNDSLEIIMQKGPYSVNLAGNVTLSRGKGISSYISRQKKPVILPSLEHSQVGKNYQFNSFLALPLWIADRLIGLLNLGHDRANQYRDAYSQDYEQMGQQISLVMEKMHLRAEVQAQNHLLQKTLDDLREAQHRLIDRERLAAIGEIVVTINHKINNPLATIVTNAEILSMIVQENQSERARTLTDRIFRAARQISDFTKQLSNLSEARKKEYLPNVAMIAIPEK